MSLDYFSVLIDEDWDRETELPDRSNYGLDLFFRVIAGVVLAWFQLRGAPYLLLIFAQAFDLAGLAFSHDSISGCTRRVARWRDGLDAGRFRSWVSAHPVHGVGAPWPPPLQTEEKLTPEDDKRLEIDFLMIQSQREMFWNAQAAVRDSAGRGSNTFFTSLIILNGGAITALVSALGAETFIASASSGEASFYDWMFRLFTISLCATLMSVASGRLSDDATLRALQFKADTHPPEIVFDQGHLVFHKVFQAASYGLAIVALIAFTTALVSIAMAV